MIPSVKTISHAPEFKRENWDNVEFVWDHKPFLRTSVTEFLHHPVLNSIESLNEQLLQKAQANNVACDASEMLLLRHPLSSWREEILLSVTKPLENDPDYTEISGTFRSLIFEGRPAQLRSFFRQMNDMLEYRNEMAVSYYLQKLNSEIMADGNEHNTYLLIAQVANRRSSYEPLDIDVTMPNILFES